MPATVVNVHEAKSNLSRLLARVEAGEQITVARAGRPVARLTPVPRAGRRRPGRFKGMFGNLTTAEALAPIPPEYSGAAPSPNDPLEQT